MTMNGKPLAEVPSINSLLAILEYIASVPLAELPALLGTLEQTKALGWGRLLAAPSNGQGEGELLTVPEVAQRLKVSEYRAYELVRQGKIKKTPLGESKGSSVRVKPSDLAAYLAQQGG